MITSSFSIGYSCRIKSLKISGRCFSSFLAAMTTDTTGNFLEEETGKTLCLNNPIVSTVGNGKVESVCLTLLFSFDFLHLFISALKEYKNDKNISSETYEKLRQLLQ